MDISEKAAVFFRLIFFTFQFIRESRNSNKERQDDAFELMGLFTKQNVKRYCMTKGDQGVEEMMQQIENDTEEICDLYWYESQLKKV